MSEEEQPTIVIDGNLDPVESQYDYENSEEESEEESDTDGEGEEGEEGDTERREWESGGWTEIVPERDKG